MSQTAPLSDNQTTVIIFTRIRLATIILVTLVILYLKYIVLFNIPVMPIFVLLLVAVSYNAVYTFLTRRFPAFSDQFGFYYFRSSLDIAAITVLMHYTGGAESPFILIYLLVLLSISIFGMTTAAYFIAVQASLFYLASNMLEATFLLPHYQLSALPESLYLSFNYILAISFSICITSVLMIYLTSYLNSKILANQKKIEELSNSRVDFINQVAHEIRSPLTSVIGYTQFLSDQRLGPLAEAQKEPMRVIERQGRRILDLVNDLLNFARLESGAVKFEKKSASIIDVAAQAIEEFMPQIDSKHIQLVREFDPQTPRIIMDETKIHEVFTNLISNAIKFCGDGCRIFLSIAPGKNEVVVSLRDEGLGIEPADLPHIFERFYRASKESAERKGTGLGLAICKSIVEAHGGHIWAVSAGVDKGTVFHFALPLAS